MINLHDINSLQNTEQQCTFRISHHCTLRIVTLACAHNGALVFLKDRYRDCYLQVRSGLWISQNTSSVHNIKGTITTPRILFMNNLFNSFHWFSPRRYAWARVPSIVEKNIHVPREKRFNNRYILLRFPWQK